MMTSPSAGEARVWLSTEISRCVRTGDDIGLPEYFVDHSAYEALKAQLEQVRALKGMCERKLLETTKERDAAVAERDEWKERYSILRTSTEKFNTEFNQLKCEKTNLFERLNERITELSLTKEKLSQAEKEKLSQAEAELEAKKEMFINESDGFTAHKQALERKLSAERSRADRAEGEAAKLQFYKDNADPTLSKVLSELTAERERAEKAEKAYEELYTLYHKDINAANAKSQALAAALEKIAEDFGTDWADRNVFLAYNALKAHAGEGEK